MDKLRPLGEFAFQLIRRAIECEFKIVISDHVLTELENNIDENKIRDVINSLKEVSKLIHLNVTDADKKKARELSRNRNTPYDDTLHVILANKAKVKFLVTRNVEHFSELNDLVEIVYPESI